jgi:RNA polymerase sigma-70 factor (TIGR02960 family)
MVDFPRPTRVTEPIWLEPYPDVLLEGLPDLAPGPDVRYEIKESVALAFVAALQRLPPRQRAVLVLREVLGFAAAEVAAMLEVSEASVNSALQRARGTLDAAGSWWGARSGSGSGSGLVARERAPLPRSARGRELVGRFADAFEADDVDAVVALLTKDALVTMPPEPLGYQGPAAIGALLREVVRRRDGPRVQLVPTRANGQPAFGYYLPDPHAPIRRAYGLLVLELAGDQISGITRFGDTGLFARFGLPRVLPE